MAVNHPISAKRLAPRRIALHAEALAAVIGASLAIRLLPFPRVVAARPAPRQGGDADIALLRAVVRAWSRRVPWRALCFESALALRTMLRRRGVDAVLHYGMAREERLRAHVWLTVAGETVIGGDAHGYKEVARFPPARVR
jgi:Transglutaminase-like superfamily